MTAEPPRTLVVLRRKSVVTFRPPTPEERDQWGDTWVADVHLYGRHVGTWPADRHEFTAR